MSKKRLIEGKTISRRRFFLYAWAVSVLALMGEAVAMILSFIKPRVQAGTFGGKITVGKVEEFPPAGTSHCVATTPAGWSLTYNP